MKQQVQSNTAAYKGPEVFSMGTNFRKPTSQLKKIEIVFQKIQMRKTQIPLPCDSKHESGTFKALGFLADR